GPMPTPRRRPVILLPLLLLAAACGRGAAIAPTSEPQPADGGPLTYALTGDPLSVTPLYGGDPSGIAVERNVFQGLVDADPATLRVVPSIARSWSSNADGTEWTLHLRPPVRFPGGNRPADASTRVRH